MSDKPFRSWLAKASKANAVYRKSDTSTTYLHNVMKEDVFVHPENVMLACGTSQYDDRSTREQLKYTVYDGGRYDIDSIKNEDHDDMDPWLDDFFKRDAIPRRQKDHVNFGDTPDDIEKSGEMESQLLVSDPEQLLPVVYVEETAQIFQRDKKDSNDDMQIDENKNQISVSESEKGPVQVDVKEKSSTVYEVTNTCEPSIGKAKSTPKSNIFQWDKEHSNDHIQINENKSQILEPESEKVLVRVDVNENSSTVYELTNACEPSIGKPKSTQKSTGGKVRSNSYRCIIL